MSVWGKTRNRVTMFLMGALVALAWGGAASAECMSPYQVEIEEYDETIVRNILMAAQGDIERFFDLELDGFCIETEPETAYFTHQAPDYDAMVLSEDFLFEMSDKPWNFNALISILAHEGAHGFQIKYDLLGALNYESGGYVECLELHADFMAGGFMRWTSEKYEVDMAQLSRLFFTLGDHDYTANSHHGPPAKRFLAFKSGFEAPADNEKTLGAMGLAYVYDTDCGSG